MLSTLYIDNQSAYHATLDVNDKYLLRATSHGTIFFCTFFQEEQTVYIHREQICSAQSSNVFEKRSSFRSWYLSLVSFHSTLRSSKNRLYKYKTIRIHQNLTLEQLLFSYHLKYKINSVRIQ